MYGSSLLYPKHTDPHLLSSLSLSVTDPSAALEVSVFGLEVAASPQRRSPDASLVQR